MNNTSITQNTIDLQEILNTVENLPEAGSGGGVAVQSDYAQNDSTQLDYIKNRPFYRSEGYSYEWDGKATDESKKVSGNDPHFFYYKISDNIMTVSDLVGAKVILSNGTRTISESDINEYGNGSFYYKLLSYVFIIACVETGSFDTSLGELELTPGLWFLNGGFYAQELKKDADIKQIDNEFIAKATTIDEANADLPVTAGLIKTELAKKADLVGGKIPVEQLPDGIGSGSASGGTGTGGTGQDGISPTVTVDAIEGGHRVTITDANDPPKQFDVMDGQDGNDGISPTIEVTPTEGGHTVSITDASGATNSFDVLNGINGTSVTHSWEGTFLTITSASGQSYPVDLKGEKGDPFEYEDFTEDQLKALKPVKDVDYFDGKDYILTDADKTDIANKTKGLLDATVQEMREIASGKCKADAFDTVEDMTTWLSDTNNTANLKLGDVFYIRAVDVPDYWWEPIVDDVELSKYTEKDVIISGIGAARILETTKVALEDYVLTKDAPTIKVNNAVNADTISGKTIQVITGGQPADGTSDNVITIVI